MTQDAEQSDLLAAYLAGGLPADERTRLETRLAADPALAAQLESLMALDLSLKQSAGVNAILAGFEDRLAAAVEAAKPPRRFAVHPLVRKAALAAAACLLLGTTGYFASTAMDEGKLPLWESGQPRVAANLRQIGGALLLYSNENKGSFPRIDDSRFITAFSGDFVATGDLNTERFTAPSGTAEKDDMGRDSSGPAIHGEEARKGDANNAWYDGGFNYKPQGELRSHGSDTLAFFQHALRQTATSAYQPGSGVQPFKPGESLKWDDRLHRADTITGKTKNVDTDGQNVLYADGHLEFAKTPLTGTQKENSYTGGTQINGGSLGIDANSADVSGNITSGHEFRSGIKLKDATTSAGMVDKVAIPGQSAVTSDVDLDKNPGVGMMTDKPRDSRGIVENGVIARRGEVLYNFTQALDELRTSTGTGDLSAAQNALTAARVARESANQDYTDAEKRNMDQQLAEAQIAIDQAKVASTPSNMIAAAQLEREKPERAQQEREGTVKALERNAATLRQQGKDQEASAVAKRILVIDPQNTFAKNQLAMGDGKGPADNGGKNAPGTQPTGVAPEVRKIIRSGELVFEVDRFDSAANTIGKIVTEDGGLVATTNSDKLPNGKVRGEIIVRVPPDKLDMFILQLRALGDLKSQRLGSADVSKEYYDLDSDLRAARAMEARLLDMIKNGKGEIKDLLEAEKELANWRGKIEKILGQQKYYDNLVSLATLTITLQEKDIATPAAAVENESITAGVETDDVEKARTAALEILKDARARIISSDLKKLDAGQVASTIVADIPPDGSGAVVDRIKQLGKVARLESTRSMTADPNASSTSPTPKLERKDSRLTLSLYNVANVAPRQTTTIELASTDVSATYNAIAAKALKAGGRVVRGGATQGRDNSSRAEGAFEVPAEAADAFLADVKSLGDVVSLASTESQDTANVTTSKRGLTLTIWPVAAMPPRQSASLRVEAGDVDAASATLQAALLQAGGRIVFANTSTDPAGQSTARVALEAPLAKAADLIATAKSLGIVRAINSTQNAAAPAGNLAKVSLDVTFATPGPIMPESGGLMANVRNGLSISAKGLVFSAKMIVVGLCFVLPWAVVLWAGVKIFRRKKTATSST